MMTNKVLKDFLLYFLADGTVKWMNMDTLLQNKRSEELAYIKFLLEKRVEFTNGRNKTLRTWLERIFTKIREEYILMKGGPPVFKLKCCLARGDDEEIEIKILKVLKDHWGPFVIYKSTDREFYNVSINQMFGTQVQAR